MRILQIIDSLEIGGAERMAVNYANALAHRIPFSGLVATRREGNLQLQLDKKVNYLFLARKGTVDLSAAWRLRCFCKKNNVDWLQPHSSSYFIAVMVKILYPKIKIAWHDHNGLSEFLGSQKWIPLKIASFFFKGVIVVNYQLKNWAVKELYCRNVVYLPNFTNTEAADLQETHLEGHDGKRILCLANLRDQKNHFLLVKIAKRLIISHPDWTFHLVGKDFNDDYSDRLSAEIKLEKLEEHIFLYGTRNDSAHIIGQSEIAILTSKSEGLPVALLEYGLQKKAVVATHVGEIPMIIKDGINGYIVGSNEEQPFYEALVRLIDDPEMRNRFGLALYQTIMQNNAEGAVLDAYLNWLNKM